MSKKKTRAKPASSRYPWILPVVILSVATLAAYWNSFGVPLVFDDLATIQQNASVRFGEFHWNLFAARSVLYLTFTLNYIWAGQEVWSYHLINFLLHLLNGFLVFVIASRLFRLIEDNANRCRTFAGLAAGFFLLHPVQTESVTYISSRSELLSTFFYLIGFLIFMLWPQRRIGFLCSLAVAVPYFFGLGSKETVITLPATIFLYDFLFMSKAEFLPVLSRWRFYGTYVVGASAATYYLLTGTLKGSVGSAGHLFSWTYFLTEVRVIIRYVQLVFWPFWPAGLNLDYDFRKSSSLLEPSVIISIVLLSCLFWLALWLRRRQPIFAFSILWFFITLSPTSSVIPVADVIFEHRLYLPLIGVSMSFPFLVELVYRKFRQRLALRETVSGSRALSAVTYSCLILIALLVGTIMRNHVWGDEVRLFTDVVAKSPGKDRAYNALAWAYYKRGEYGPAIDVLESGLRNLPDKQADFTETLGNLYLKTGRYDQAVEFFKKNTESFTGERLAVAYNNMGVAYLYLWSDLQGRRVQMSPEAFDARREQILKPASEAFLKGLDVEHNMPWALDSYVNTMSYRGKGNEIESSALERLKQKETFEDLYTVGKVAFNNTDYAKADQYFERAEKVRKDAKILFFNHGYALTQLKQLDRAIEKYVESIRLDPIFIEAHHNVGQLYMQRNQYGKAAESFAEVLRLDPKHVSSHLNLASIYMAQGNKLLARSHLSTVLEVSPGNQQAATMLTQLGF